MAFRPPPLLQKVLRFKSMEHKDGKFLLWGTPCLISPLNVTVFLFKFLGENYGFDTAKECMYFTGKFQAKLGIYIINKRFGYAKTILDKRRLLEFNTTQTEVLGLGQWHWKRMGLGTDNIFIVYGISPFAEMYKRLFGMSKDVVDYFHMGIAAGGIEATVTEKMVCIEETCVAKGDSYCQFITKPIDQWDRNDKLVKQNKFLFEKSDLDKKLQEKINVVLAIKPE